MGIVKIGTDEYPFPDIDSITFREAQLIKRLTGLRMGEYADAFEIVDSDLLFGLAAVALLRSDRDADVERLLDMNIDAISFDFSDEKGPDLPPTEAPSLSSGGNDGDVPTGQTTESEESGTPSSSNGTDSGPGSLTTSPTQSGT